MPDNDPFAETALQFEQVLQQQNQIKRRALQAVNAVVLPRLVEAAPERLDVKEGGNSLEPGLLKAAAHGIVHIGAGGDDPSYAECNFGPLDHIARFVDTGHKPPHARDLERRGLKDERDRIPAHPFVRQVQDECEASAQEAFETTMQIETAKVFDGK